MMAKYHSQLASPRFFFLILVLMAAFLVSGGASQAQIISDHTRTDLSQVSTEDIEAVRDRFRIWYGHTSHGSQIISGMQMIDSAPYLLNYNGQGPANGLYLRDEGGDLGHEGDLSWADTTQSVLNVPNNDINVVVWSWCGGVSDNTAQGINTYLEAMSLLEAEYPNVIFIYMTGHLNGTGETGNLHIRNNQIREYCQANKKVLFDFADIESYDPDGNYYLDLEANDNCDYYLGGEQRNWAVEWCSAHPGECPSPCQADEDCAHSQCLNCLLKGRAFWWLMSQLLDWNPSIVTPENINTSQNFPDQNFRAAVEEALQVEPGGKFTASLAAGYSDWLDCSSRQIEDMTGLGFLKNLRGLDCGYNQIKQLDVSGNTGLVELFCDENQLTNLDVSQNTALTHLGCAYNQLDRLDVSKNSALSFLNCSGNQLGTLAVSKNSALVELFCDENQLMNLDVSQNAALTDLGCAYNQLDRLDVSKNTALSYLNCWGNRLETLDVSKNTALVELFCDENQLTDLDVSQNAALTHLVCSGNQLENLDLSHNTALSVLYCGYNQLANMDISNNLNLTELECAYNQLANLDVIKHTALTYLGCDGNQLQSLDVTANTSLLYLNCAENQLANLDLSNHTELEELICYGNQITTLDISQVSDMTILDCGSNQLTNVTNFAANENLAAGDYVDIRENHLDCGDWDDVVALQNRIGDPVLNEWGDIESGFVYSPQIGLDPYECGTNVADWFVF